MSGSLPPLPKGFTYRLDLARAATPRLLKQRPIHRWFYFPHSYSPELVEAVLNTWELQTGSYIVDPFVGAGTTCLVAFKNKRNSIGIDLKSEYIEITKRRIFKYRIEQTKLGKKSK